MSEVLHIVEVREGKLLVGESNLLRKMGLGTPSIGKEGIVLDVSEAAYLIYTETAQLIDTDGEALTLEELFSRYSSGRYDWIKFSVMLDLRSRGRRVRAGFAPNTLVMDLGGRRVAVFVAEENSPLRAGEVVEWAEDAVRKGYDPLMALVDANGDVTYYSMRKMRIDDLVGEFRR